MIPPVFVFVLIFVLVFVFMFVLILVLILVFILVLVFVLVVVEVVFEVLFCVITTFLIHNPFVAKENPWLHVKHELGPRFIQLESKNVHNLEVDPIL